MRLPVLDTEDPAVLAQDTSPEAATLVQDTTDRPEATAARVPEMQERPKGGSTLTVFADMLKRYTSYLGWRELSSLSYGGASTACSIVSSIEFDRDGEVFAVAGVTKKIKVCPAAVGTERAREW